MHVVRPTTILVACMTMLAICPSAIAMFTSTVTASHVASTGALSAPTNLVANTADGCTEIVLSWQTSPFAETSKVKAREDGGAWIELSDDTGGTTLLIDPNDRTGHQVEYQINERAGTNWEGPTATTLAVAC